MEEEVYWDPDARIALDVSWRDLVLLEVVLKDEHEGLLSGQTFLDGDSADDAVQDLSTIGHLLELVRESLGKIERRP